MACDLEVSSRPLIELHNTSTTTNPHMSQHILASEFRRLHTTGAHSPLVLPNAWDAMSARLVEAAGAPAIATTSAGISWALGYPDGHGLTRDAMVEAVRRIVHSVRVPVSADVESGYGAGSPDDVAETVTRVIEVGAVGVNFEDSPGPSGAKLVDISYQQARFASAREAAKATGVDLFINARIDTYLKGVGEEGETRFEETVRRARAYVAAGADCVFVPLVTDPTLIKRLVASVGAPLNLLGLPGSPTISAMRALGVARVSVGPGLVRSVMAHVRRAATELFGDGGYDAISVQIPSPEANALFAARP
jgi:2-methylisocitrate lyase-like PEP mutase family enzyme